MRKYILDTNSLIRPYVSNWYHYKIIKSYWTKFEEEFLNGSSMITDSVYDEINSKRKTGWQFGLEILEKEAEN